MKNKSSAFSLIELSIVILIIGVLIAGVTQASRLVRQSKLTTARTLTQSSAVNSIKGLVLWLEPTMENSFKSSEAVDGTTLTTWYDINPQLSIPNTFSAGTGITYKASSGINSLPAVAFADNNTSLSNTLAVPINAPFGSYTVCYVARSTNLTAENTILYNGTSGTNGFGISLTSTGATKVTYGVSSTFNFGITAAAASGNADIVCVTFDPNSVNGVPQATAAAKAYKNGGGVSSDTAKTITVSNWVDPTSGAVRVGNSTASSTTTDFIGEIAEIIIFDNALKKADRQEVEKYLSKKYGITIAQGAN